MPMQKREIRKDQDLVREGDRPSQCFTILEGFTYRYKLLPDGKRQVFCFHIAGDIPDLQGLFLEHMDHCIGSLTPVTVGLTQHTAFRDMLEKHPRIAAALWRDTLIEASILREWMAGIGRRDARTRIVHMLCEVITRQAAIGNVTCNLECLAPFTQGTIADALGLSVVHVNRTIQDLRREGLIFFAKGILTVPDWEGLKLAGDFDPSYLHLTKPVFALH